MIFQVGEKYTLIKCPVLVTTPILNRIGTVTMSDENSVKFQFLFGTLVVSYSEIEKEEFKFEIISSTG